jgi:hypothetical protein
MYDDAPGKWLAELGGSLDSGVDPHQAENYLAPVVGSLVDGRGPVATAIKAIHFRQMLSADKLRFAPGTFPHEELTRYPGRGQVPARGVTERHPRA